MLKRLITVCLICLSGATFGQSAASKYIEMYKEDAIRKMNEYGIPASIILGVAIHESGSGTSKIAKYLNNHFGKKGHNDSKEIRSAYKGYSSVSESYDDFITMMKTRVQFSKLFDKYAPTDYKNWAKGIQRGGYAHSKTWSSQVLAIINKYKLYEFDSPKAESELAGNTDVAIASAYIRPLDPVEAQPAPVAAKVYRVKSGDTLLAIAKKFGTTVNSIREKNELRSTSLSIGQRLKL